MHAFYYFNIVVQSIFSLACPIGLLTLLAWYLCDRGYTGKWIYAVLILLGVFIGLYSMIRYILSASAQVHALEKAEEEKEMAKREKEYLQKEEEKP